MKDYIKQFRLDSQLAFVVGGIGLIGTEVSQALASAGAKVVALDIQSDQGKALAKKIMAANYDFTFHQFDCSEISQLDNNFSLLLKKYGCPNIFVNCSYPRNADWGKSSFNEIKQESFRKNIDIHMNSYAWLARLAAEAMVKDDNGGSIIQLGSIYGIVGQDLTVYEGTDMHENMTYAVIKGGIISLTRQMASYYGQYNIRVNTLCPGGLRGHVSATNGDQSPVFIRQYSKKVPLKRLGRAEEIASTALFLSSDAASYITGAIIMVDGGWSIV